MKRRNIIKYIGATSLIITCGCSSVNDSRSQSPDKTSETGGTKTKSAQPAVEPETVLPEPGDGWQLATTDAVGAQPLGGVPGGGASGEYTSPADEQFTVVVIRMRSSFDPSDLAESWACIDWDVAVAYEQWAFAAGTGTTQQTFTPEAPPHLDRSPVPGTETASRELLSRSPILSVDKVRDHAVVCDR